MIRTIQCPSGETCYDEAFAYSEDHGMTPPIDWRSLAIALLVVACVVAFGWLAGGLTWN